MKFDRILHTPEGVRDIYDGECERKLILEDILQQKMRLYGFENIQTPTLEYFDVFSEERGTFAAKDMYKLFDREGNTLVLRPDITPSIARCVAKYFMPDSRTVRLCYTGNTFINSSEYQGKPKEITQTGAELIGDASVTADAEILALTVECLLAAGLKEFQVEVGEVGFFKAIIEEAGINADDLEELMILINDKNSFGLEAFIDKLSLNDELKKVFMKLPAMFGSIDKLAEFKNMTNNLSATAAIERLERIYELMKLYGYEKYVSFDLGMLSKFGYYTGIIFNAYTYGLGDALISGGRYDKLVGQFGKDTPAVGMAVFVDRLLTAVMRQGIEFETKAPVQCFKTNEACCEAELKKVIELRRSGKPAKLDVI
ncbi:MAG: ATP phosphoribosyltransferase regulatory subunit [Lachnospiraceae bacterium]|nr:ATP phosphoribosyltransferase regulatory subunit [Lachnospiraceae bacterium]